MKRTPNEARPDGQARVEDCSVRNTCPIDIRGEGSQPCPRTTDRWVFPIAVVRSRPVALSAEAVCRPVAEGRLSHGHPEESWESAGGLTGEVIDIVGEFEPLNFTNARLHQRLLKRAACGSACLVGVGCDHEATPDRAQLGDYPAGVPGR